MKKILIIADLRGWIFERHAKEIQKRLTEYKIDIGYSRGTNINATWPNYDLVYVMDPMIISYPPADRTILGLRAEWLYVKCPGGAKGLYEKGFPSACVAIKDHCCMFHVVNKRQLKVFEPIVTDKPLLLVQHGVDETCFNRDMYPKLKNDILTIGTSGRKDSPGCKGFNLISNACKKVGARHLGTRYQGGKRLTKEQMPIFYNALDIYVCMSETEGLCNPVIEAGAMGVPVISTRAGAAEEMIVDGESGLLIDRNVDALVVALNKLKDRKCREEMGDKFYQEIMNKWSWEHKIEEYKKMFQMFFESHAK